MEHKIGHISGRYQPASNAWWTLCLSPCTVRAKGRAGHQGGSKSGLTAAPAQKGAITANESKDGSDMNWSPVLWPLWLLGYFHVAVLDDFSKAGACRQ